MQNRFTLSLIVAASAGVLLSPACYTLLKHPRVKQVVYEEVNDTRCNQCHDPDQLWLFHHSPNHPFGYDLGHDGWAYYYSIPWWYDSYWYYEGDDPATVPLHRRRLRPGAARDPAGYGGAVPPPPTTRPISTPVKLKTDDETKGKNDEKPSKKRTVRPGRKKQKDKDDDKEKDDR